jgi:hypothetical protein
MPEPFRLLVTGSRTWDDVSRVEHALAVILARHPEGIVLVHGACPRGADAIAADYAAARPGTRSKAGPPTGGCMAAPPGTGATPR